MKRGIVVKLRYSKVALRDLEQIDDYIAEELKNPSAALNMVGKIQDAIDKLVAFPQMGAPLSIRYEGLDDYRYLICGHYLAFYRITEDVVFVDRILYGRRDYLKILFGELQEENKQA
ncbi:MAG: type II toxin-antitoxin system RelE/ParE family toxin [Christensenellaceae bacterium]|nr:type II toxin-antitoxin system RelE/ParE family toxin [Christensenellaceae bacterium]